MLRLQGLPLIGVDYPRLSAQHLFQGKVGGIVAITEGDHVAGASLDLPQQGIEGHALPVRVQFRPLGHAVDVFGHRLVWQGLKFIPVPAFRVIDLPHNGEIPGCERRMRRRPRREDGKAALQILPRRESCARVALLATAAEPAREEPFTHLFTS